MVCKLIDIHYKQSKLILKVKHTNLTNIILSKNIFAEQFSNDFEIICWTINIIYVNVTKDIHSLMRKYKYLSNKSNNPN